MDFEEAYRRFSPKIFRLCMGYFNDPDTAKDLTQETFIAVWEGLPKFRNEAQTGTWLLRPFTAKKSKEKTAKMLDKISEIRRDF